MAEDSKKTLSTIVQIDEQRIQDHPGGTDIDDCLAGSWRVLKASGPATAARTGDDGRGLHDAPLRRCHGCGRSHQNWGQSKNPRISTPTSNTAN